MTDSPWGNAPTDMIVTTTNGIDGRPVQRYCGVVTGEVIVGANLFRDLFASVRDIVGGRSGAYEEVLGRAREEALSEMRSRGAALGANAVIGVDLDYEVIGANGSMLMVSATGTAVASDAMTGRIAIITGAGSGIGRAVALTLAAKGYKLTLAGRRADALEETASLATGSPEPILCLPTDVSDPASVKALFDKTVERFGRLDLLFNNAGLNGGRFQIEDMTVERFREVVDVNLTGSFLCMQAAFRIMKDQTPQGGRIINNGSISAYSPRPDTVAYCASKHGVSGLTKAGSLEGRKYDIAVGQIDIGNAASGFSESFARGVPQADGRLVPEPVMDASLVGDAVLYMDSLPLDANIFELTVMPTKMPFVGRG